MDNGDDDDLGGNEVILLAIFRSANPFPVPLAHGAVSDSHLHSDVDDDDGNNDDLNGNEIFFA